MNIDNNFQTPLKQDRFYGFTEAEAVAYCNNNPGHKYELLVMKESGEEVFVTDKRPFDWDKNPEKKEDRELDIECICGHCILRIFEDNYYKEPTYNFAVYSNRPSSFWRRIKKAWKFVWKGEQLLLEDLELTKEDFLKLKEFTS